ncbi:MAG: serine/threonine protein kinase, partial [Deltaproteobacteria bacterium]|nr:serine/threonine protein kinase [Deltaproteobacteria bacterium]
MPAPWRRPDCGGRAMASKSQICSSCGKAYVAGELFCPLDGTRLQPGPRGESGPAAPGQPAAPAPAAALPPPPPPRALAGGKGSATAAADVSKKHAASKERRDPWIGRIIGGRYRLIAFLGAGGMAAVYLARHEMLGKVLALKLLKPNLPTSTQAMERFRREARTVSLINHENVVYLTDFGETEEGTLYMVMEYLAGKTLAEVLHDEGRLGAARAMAISLQVARALEAAHGVGVIHRDLKPENLMLLDPGSSSEKVKILDFGIAKLLDPEMEKERLTRAGMVFGTPEYMSPEQAMGEELDGRTDLYSLGLILWEMLTGQRCFHGRSATETLAMQVTTPPLRPSQILPEEEISEGLEQVVMCLLEKKRDKRIPSARALVRELVTLRGSRRIKREAEEAHSLAAGVPPAGAAMAAAGAGPAARRIVALPGKSGKGSAGGERQVVPPAREAHAEPDAARASADASPAPAEPPCIEPAAPVDDDKATTPWARKQPLDEHTTPSAQQAEGAACQERLPISQLPTQLLQQGLAAPPATEAGREAAPAADDASAAAERPAPAAALASGSPAEPLPPETPPLPLPPLVPLPMDWLDPLEAPPGEALDGASGDMPQLQGAPDTGKVSSSPPL